MVGTSVDWLADKEMAPADIGSRQMDRQIAISWSINGNQSLGHPIRRWTKGTNSDCNIYLLAGWFSIFKKNLLIWIFSIKCDASAIFRANVSPGQWKKNHTHVTSSGRKWTLTLSADEISIRCQSLYLQEEGKIQSDSGDRCKQRDRIRSLSIKRRVFQKGLEGFQS